MWESSVMECEKCPRGQAQISPKEIQSPQTQHVSEQPPQRNGEANCSSEWRKSELSEIPSPPLSLIHTNQCNIGKVLI